MARTELPNGVILPAEYSDDWYEDMTSNLTKLDDVIGSDSEKLNSNDVAFLRMSSAALTDGGTGNFSDLNSSNKLKTGDYVLDSGRKLYQIVSVNSATETFTVGNSLFKVTAESDLAPVAESGDYDDLDNKPDLNPYDQHIANTDIHVTTADKNKWNNQTYVFRYSSTALVASSTNSNALLDNTDNLKVGDKVIDSSGVLFSITAIDTQNSTFTIGTALIDLAQDSDVVHKSGDETTGGIKTFSNYIPIDGTYLGNESSTNERTNLCLRSNRDTTDLSGAYISRFRVNKNQGALSESDNSFISISFLENGTRYTRCFDFGLTDWDADGIPQTYYFTSPGSKGALGTSSRKWQTINGLEPSVLSLPSGNTSDRLDISSYITAFDGTKNSYTPPANGWISISVNNCTEVYVFLNNLYGVDDNRPTAGSIRVTLPVLKGIMVGIRITGGSLVFARFLPCQGNV